MKEKLKYKRFKKKKAETVPATSQCFKVHEGAQ